MNRFLEEFLALGPPAATPLASQLGTKRFIFCMPRVQMNDITGRIPGAMQVYLEACR